MFLINVMILLLAIGNGVKTEDATEWGSGDANNPASTTGSLYLIDENGDIASPSTEKPGPVDAISAESESELVSDRNLNEMNGNESVTLMTNITDDGMTTTSFPMSSTDAFVVVTNETTVETTSTTLPTTETTTESETTTTSTTTVSTPTSTTEVSTTGFDEVSTVTTEQTTTFISSTTMMEKTEKSTAHIPQSSTTDVPVGDRQPCEPVNMDFHCFEDFQCYGEGEIDCSRTVVRNPGDLLNPSSTQEAGNVSTATPDDTTEETANSRQKRHDINYKDPVLQLIEWKFTHGILCRLSGNLVCSPPPTYSSCRGKTFCRVIKRTNETATETAEASSAKGLKTWVISVITICAFFGLMTVFMIIYLLVTSCKKLKVQPTPDVTTLNYITRKGENPEIA